MKIEKNVREFMDWCAREIGKWEEDNWSIELFNNLTDYTGIESPIERILFCAVKTALQLNYLDDSVRFDPQCEVGNYRVDFIIRYFPHRGRTKPEEIKNILIECDSQEWHERTEKERRYEKKRDRYIQSQGFKIFHYTGTEILKNPMEIAVEIISELTGQKREDLLTDSNEEVS